MQVGYGDKVRVYRTEIPNIGSILGLVDMQRMINYFEKLATQVDSKDPYASPLAKILDSKTVEDLVKEVTDVPEVFEVFTAASLSCWGCELNQISALYALADANSAGKEIETEKGQVQNVLFGVFCVVSVYDWVRAQFIDDHYTRR